MRAIHEFERQAPAKVDLWLRKIFSEEVQPLVGRVVAHVRGISQQLDCLKMRIEHGFRAAGYIDKANLASGSDHAPDFAQCAPYIPPVMRTIAADHPIEFGRPIRKRFDGA
jgi:hypothetical protein